jgi:hypothetical protein
MLILVLGGDGVEEGCGQHHGGFSSENETSTRSHFFRILISLVDHEAKCSAGRVCISLFFILFYFLALLLCSTTVLTTPFGQRQRHGACRPTVNPGMVVVRNAVFARCRHEVPQTAVSLSRIDGFALGLLFNSWPIVWDMGSGGHDKWEPWDGWMSD